MTSTTPISGATGVSTSAAPTATFSEAVQAGTISFVVRDAANAVVAGSTVYTAATNLATFTPTSPLATSATYTATVSGALDTAGNAMAAPISWSFTTAAAASTLSSIFSSSVTPVVSASSDSGAVELGVKFRSDVAGQVTGVRFYKGTGNTGTHVGNLWSSTGTLVGDSDVLG